MSRAESHDVGGEGRDVAEMLDTAEGDCSTASHEKAGGDSLPRLSLRVMVASKSRRARRAR